MIILGALFVTQIIHSPSFVTASSSTLEQNNSISSDAITPDTLDAKPVPADFEAKLVYNMSDWDSDGSADTVMYEIQFYLSVEGVYLLTVKRNITVMPGGGQVFNIDSDHFNLDVYANSTGWVSYFNYWHSPQNSTYQLELIVTDRQDYSSNEPPVIATLKTLDLEFTPYIFDITGSFNQISQDSDINNDTIAFKFSILYPYKGIEYSVYIYITFGVRFWNVTTETWMMMGNENFSPFITFDEPATNDLYEYTEVFLAPYDGKYNLSVSIDTGYTSTKSEFYSSYFESTNMTAFDPNLQLNVEEKDWDLDTFYDTLEFNYLFEYDQIDLYDTTEMNLQLKYTVYSRNDTENEWEWIVNDDMVYDRKKHSGNIYELNLFWNIPVDGDYKFDITLVDNTYTQGRVFIFKDTVLWDNLNKYAPTYNTWLGRGIVEETDDDFDKSIDTIEYKTRIGILDYLEYVGLTVSYGFATELFKWDDTTSKWVFYKGSSEKIDIVINQDTVSHYFDFFYRAEEAGDYKLVVTTTFADEVSYVDYVYWTDVSVFTGLFYDWDYSYEFADTNGDEQNDTVNVEISVEFYKLGTVEFKFYVDVYVGDLWYEDPIDSFSETKTFTVTAIGWETFSASWGSPEENNYYLHIYAKDLAENTIIDFGIYAYPLYSASLQTSSSPISTNAGTTTSTSPQSTNGGPTSSDEPSVSIASYQIALLSILSLVAIKSYQRKGKRI